MTSSQCEQGDCFDGGCVCDEGWTGAFCNSPALPLTMRPLSIEVFGPGTCEVDGLGIDAYLVRFYDGNSLVETIEDFLPANATVNCNVATLEWQNAFVAGFSSGVLEPETKYTMEFGYVADGQDVIVGSWKFVPWEFSNATWFKDERLFYEIDGVVAFEIFYDYTYE